MIMPTRKQWEANVGFPVFVAVQDTLNWGSKSLYFYTVPDILATQSPKSATFQKFMFTFPARQFLPISCASSQHLYILPEVLATNSARSPAFSEYLPKREVYWFFNSTFMAPDDDLLLDMVAERGLFEAPSTSHSRFVIT